MHSIQLSPLLLLWGVEDIPKSVRIASFTLSVASQLLKKEQTEHYPVAAKLLLEVVLTCLGQVNAWDKSSQHLADLPFEVGTERIACTLHYTKIGLEAVELLQRYLPEYIK